MKCQDCNAWCCKGVDFKVFSDDHKKWCELHGLNVVRRSGSDWVHFKIPCGKLRKNKCTIYEDRPEICKIWKCDEYETPDKSA